MRARHVTNFTSARNMSVNAAMNSESSFVWASPLTQAREITDELNRRGKRLRDAIKRTYQKLRSENRLPFLDGNSADVTSLVVEHIPIGMPLQDAETLLRHAELKIAPQFLHWSHRNHQGRTSHMRGEAILEARMNGNAFVSVVAYPENLSASETKVSRIVGMIGIQGSLG